MSYITATPWPLLLPFAGAPIPFTQGEEVIPQSSLCEEGLHAGCDTPRLGRVPVGVSRLELRSKDPDDRAGILAITGKPPRLRSQPGQVLVRSCEQARIADLAMAGYDNLRVKVLQLLDDLDPVAAVEVHVIGRYEGEIG